jgi:SAM-dependent methyltransferase
MQSIKGFWDERYLREGFMYGKEPNLFFRIVTESIPLGKMLVPGAGEGRDAVFAATLGWSVTAVDLSSAGKIKTEQLATEKGVVVDYRVQDIAEVDFDENSFDAIAMIYVHLPSELRRNFLKKAIKWLKPGGIIFMELFTPNQLGNSSGGPKDADLLVHASDLVIEMADLDTILNIELKTELNEGTGHCGSADIVRFIGKKLKV